MPAMQYGWLKKTYFNITREFQLPVIDKTKYTDLFYPEDIKNY